MLSLRRAFLKSIAETFLTVLCRKCLTSTEFREELFSLEACKNVLNAEMYRSMSCMNIEEMIVTGCKNDGKKEQNTFYMRDLFKVIKTQMWLEREHRVNTMTWIKIMSDLGQIQETFKSRLHLMDTWLSRTVFDCARQHVMKSIEQPAVWHDHGGTCIPSLEGMVQVFTDWTATARKANGTVAYPVHISLLNCAVTDCRYWIDHGH